MEPHICLLLLWRISPQIVCYHAYGSKFLVYFQAKNQQIGQCLYAFMFQIIDYKNFYCKSRKSLSYAIRWKETRDYLTHINSKKTSYLKFCFLEDWSNFNKIDQYQFTVGMFAFLNIEIWYITADNIVERREIYWGWFAITHVSYKARTVRRRIMELCKKCETENRTLSLSIVVFTLSHLNS